MSVLYYRFKTCAKLYNESMALYFHRNRANEAYAINNDNDQPAEGEPDSSQITFP